MSLIITRRIGEGFTIGDTITVRIVGIAGAQAKIAIDAPPEVRILREELLPRAHNEGEGEV
jgi:carbon storage regulator CsrA